MIGFDTRPPGACHTRHRERDTRQGWRCKTHFGIVCLVIFLGIITLFLCQEVVRIIPIIDVYVFVVQIACHSRHRACIQDKLRYTRQISDWHVRCSFRWYGYFESNYLCRKVVRIILMIGFCVFVAKIV